MSGAGRTAAFPRIDGIADRRDRRNRRIDERDLAALAAAIEGAAIAQRDFSHARHLLLALHYLRAHGPEGASRACAPPCRPSTRGTRRPTVTTRRSRPPGSRFVARHAAEHPGAAVHDLAEGLLDRYRSSKALFAHYSRARLLSDDARAAFIAPDLAPLPGARRRRAHPPGDRGRFLAAIRGIYAFYVERSTCTFATTVPTPAERRAWLAAHGPQHPATVAVEGDRAGAGAVVGWGSLFLWNPREAYARSVENSVYVRDGLHRRGLGRRILAIS